MNPRLLILGIGLGIGYVLGTRDGRARYLQLTARVRALWEDPRVVKARRDAEAFAREQGPIIRDRASEAAKAAPGAVADTARDVADRVSAAAKDTASRASATAKNTAARASATAKDLAKDVSDRFGDAASTARDQTARVAAGLRERGETVVDSAVNTAGQARDRAMADMDSDDLGQDEPGPDDADRAPAANI